MSLHYTKSGALDMRYSSSKAAVSSGYGGSGSSSGNGGGSSSSGYRAPPSSSGNGGGGSSSYGGQSAYGSSSYSTPASGSSSTSSNLHYKKDNTLDMRYASSKAAVSTGSGYGGSSNQGSQSAYGSSSNASPASGSSSTSSNLHYKKDNTLDMRYASSKAAVGQGSSSAAAAAAAAVGSVPSSSSDGLRYTKEGKLDMRYASSKKVAALTSGVKGLQVASPGSCASLDKRYKPSKEIASSGNLGLYNIPDSVPTKADGTPDMRTKEAKDFVKHQANDYATLGLIPNWVPKQKDGKIDRSKAIGRAFLQAAPTAPYVHSGDQHIIIIDDIICSDANSRIDYYIRNLVEPSYQDVMRKERQGPEPLPPPAPLIFPQQSLLNIPENVAKLDYVSLVLESESTGTLGKGAFGIVRKATWNGIEVAVKVLHLTQLTRKEKSDFEKEICILAALGKHPNLVLLHGYCTDPPCIVMELVERGSLNHLLHYCVDPAVEAKMTDGRVKKRLLFGTADGMRQLHAEKIVHGDLKPQNVLVTIEFTAKITDFGLATLRGKTSSSIRSHESYDGDDDDEPRGGGAVGGTSGYMAPELLDSISPPDFPIDVYSFGILLNELVSEEEPYYDQYANFAARGPFAAANYARNGKRPTINKKLTPPPVENLIIQCWSKDPARRPTFENVLTTIQDAMFIIPDSVNPTS